MPPKTRQLSGQQSLKASWTAAKNVKGGVEAKKAVVSAPAPLALNIKQTAPAPAPAPAEVAKKPVKKRKSLTSDDEDSSVESEFESPIEEFEEDNVAPIEATTRDEEEKPQLDLKDKKVNEHLRKVNEKTGHMATIHTEGETKIDKILRVFDLSYEYGPCVGFTRLERWERAQALGLDPPVEVRDILLTQQGEEEKYKETVFHRRV